MRIRGSILTVFVIFAVIYMVLGFVVALPIQLLFPGLATNEAAIHHDASLRPVRVSLQPIANPRPAD